jgi:pyrimidine operon attenuation protein/uracil phosphoribosyltransferase
VGKNLPTSRDEMVRVRLDETDGEQCVHIEKIEVQVG